MRPAGLKSPLSDPRRAGIALCGAGVALLFAPWLLATALGLELIGAAFWWWARAAADAADQVTRWGWVRRPATAVWLAFAVQVAFPAPAVAPAAVPAWAGAHDWSTAFRQIEAAAVVWAALELLAALPLARAYSDLPGPFLVMRTWLPVLLPAAGFVVLWRQSAHWIAVTPVRDAAAILLVVTAALAVVRAYGRRTWTACLRWLVVTDGALAGLLVAGAVVPPAAALLLWAGAAGAHAYLLAGELHGSAPRRGALRTRLWRTACAVGLAALAWPTAAAIAALPLGRVRIAVEAGFAFTVFVAAWLSVARIRIAHDRRRVMRPGPALSATHATALAALAAGPVALALSWWGGSPLSWSAALTGLVPVAAGAWLAVLSRQNRPRELWTHVAGVGDASRTLARRLFDLVVHVERRLLAVLRGLTRAITGPVHDLHTGDAQEYLLFLVGLGVLAVVLPLLR